MEAYQRLEIEWAKFNQLDPAGMVACSSGTAALHLVLEATRDNGRHVIVPDYTMVAVPRAVTLADRKPVFIDCRPDLLLDMVRLAEYGGNPVNNVHGLVSSVVAVHTYGARCEMDGVVAFGDNYGVKVVEDLAEAHGIRPHPGTDAACWSFYKNKIVAGEEGGAVWFRNPDQAAHARRLRSLGFTDAHDYTHVPRGHNYRLSNVHAQIVRRSLLLYSYNVARRWERWDAYDAELKPWGFPRPDAPWVYAVRVPGANWAKRQRLVEEVRGYGIGVRYGFRPMTSQDEYLVGGTLDHHPNAYRAWSEVFYLTLDPTEAIGHCKADAAEVRRILERAGA